MCEIKKNWLWFLLSVILILFLAFPVFAAEKKTISTTKSVTESTTKQVVVELEAVAEEKDYFKPKEFAGYKLTIKNKLGPAWIRVKFDLTSKNINQKFTDKDLNIQEGWVKRGEYFYYTERAKRIQIILSWTVFSFLI